MRPILKLLSCEKVGLEGLLAGARVCTSSLLGQEETQSMLKIPGLELLIALKLNVYPEETKFERADSTLQPLMFVTTEKEGFCYKFFSPQFLSAVVPVI